MIFAALFVLAGCVCLSAAPALKQGRIEARVIHVDKWAVYVPNRVFYFDTHRSKSEIDKLTRAADRLRNKKALIRFYLVRTAGENQRAVLSDIEPATAKQTPQAPVKQTARPVQGPQQNAAPKLSERKAPSNEASASSTQIGDAQVAAFVEALRLAAPHTANPDEGLYSPWKIKAQNILRWSRRCTGQTMDPAQFGADTQKAREILACKMGRILREQYSIVGNVSLALRRAASWWLTGDPDKYDTPPTGSYTRKVLGFYRRLR